MNNRRIVYTPEQLLFVCARRDLPRKQLQAAFAAAFGRLDVTEAHLKALCTRNGWTTGRGEQFSSSDDALLRERFADTPTQRLAEQLQRTYAAVAVRARTLGLRKSAAYLTSRASGRLQRGDRIGAATCFQKGHAPQNKGVKRPAGWSPGRMRETQFAKGQAAWNLKPLGSVRIIDGYEFTKVGNDPHVEWTENWRQTHTIQWEALHGPVPQGQCLKSVDGNRLNTDPANWQLIPRAILPRLNGGRRKRLGYDQAPAELKPILLTVAKLGHAVKQRRTQAAA